MQLLRDIRRDDGFTLIEILAVLIITGLLAGMFGELLATSMRIYTEHNLRKTAHIDIRRAMDMTTHNIREWSSWQGAQTATKLDFRKFEFATSRFLWWVQTYFTDLRISYELSNSRLEYRRDADGSFNNRYAMLEGVVLGGSSQFNVITSGGKERVSVTVRMIVNGKPMVMRTIVFPRRQGA